MHLELSENGTDSLENPPSLELFTYRVESLNRDAQENTQDVSTPVSLGENFQAPKHNSQAYPQLSARPL